MPSITKDPKLGDAVTFYWTTIISESDERQRYTIDEVNSKLRNLCRQLLTKWRITKPPDAILSIIDGSSGGHLKEKHVRILKKGFVNAAKSSGAWILTNGKKKGIVKMIGEAVSEHRIKMNEENNEDSKDHKRKQRQILLIGFSNTQDKKDLDENHHHVKAKILNTAKTNGDKTLEPDTSSVSTHLKWEFENFMSRQEWSEEGSETFRGIPVVRVMFEGDLESLKHMVLSVRQNIPVLVLQGSGGASDFIGAAHEFYANAKYSKDIDLKDLAAQHLGIPANEINVDDEFFSDVAGVLSAKDNLVFVYSIEDTKTTLDRYLHEIMFHEFKRNLRIQDQLALVQQWNRCDIAEEGIFTLANKREIAKLKIRDPQVFGRLLKDALIGDMTDFAILYLDHITDIKNFVKYNLNDLFTECIKLSSAGHLFGNLMKTNALETSDLGDIGKGIQSLLKEGSFNPFRTYTKHTKANNENSLKMNGDVNTPRAEKHSERENAKDRNATGYRDLFIWALIFNRKDLAKAFWERNSDNICSALYASSLLNALSGVASSEGNIELSNAYMDDSRIFEKLACDIMSELYNTDKDAAHEILTKKIKLYGSTSNFELADTNILMEFMEHTACQTKINITWKGNIAPYTSFWRILLSCLFPLLIYTPLITIQREDRHTTNDSLYTFHDRITDLVTFFDAPVVKFIYNLSLYVVFLGVFSIFVLSDLYPLVDGGPTILEYFLIFWILTMFLEECRQIYTKEHDRAIEKLKSWFASVWNKFDLLAYVIFFITILLRLSLTRKDFYYARMAYAITLAMFFLRSLQFFLVAKYFGPKVYMLGRMAADTIFFILIFTVFVFSFGIMYQSTLFPNTPPSWELFKDIIYMPYWQLYGELFIEHLEGDEPSRCTSNPILYRNGTLPRCPQSNSGNTVFLAVYLVITNVLLLNVLIAMFSNTFNKVQENSALFWKFYRYGLVEEYCGRSILAPPLIIFAHVYRLCKFIQEKFKEKSQITSKSDDAYSKSKRLEIIEKEAVDNYESAPFHRYKMRKDFDMGDRKSHYKQEYELSVREHLKILSEEVQGIQRRLETICEDTTTLKKEKQTLLVFDVPRSREQLHVTNFQKPERQQN